MQNEDLASRMWSLERTLSGHITNIISMEIKQDRESKEESWNAFAEMRRIGEDLDAHTSEVKHAHEVRHSSRVRQRKENRADVVDAERIAMYRTDLSKISMRTEKSMMEMEDGRSTAVLAALARLANGGVVVNGEVVSRLGSGRQEEWQEEWQEESLERSRPERKERLLRMGRNAREERNGTAKSHQSRQPASVRVMCRRT